MTDEDVETEVHIGLAFSMQYVLLKGTICIANRRNDSKQNITDLTFWSTETVHISIHLDKGPTVKEEEDDY